jgi:hypothetical protein
MRRLSDPVERTVEGELASIIPVHAKLRQWAALAPSFDFA